MRQNPSANATSRCRLQEVDFFSVSVAAETTLEEMRGLAPVGSAFDGCLANGGPKPNESIR